MKRWEKLSKDERRCHGASDRCDRLLESLACRIFRRVNPWFAPGLVSLPSSKGRKVLRKMQALRVTDGADEASRGTRSGGESRSWLKFLWEEAQLDLTTGLENIWPRGKWMWCPM